MQSLLLAVAAIALRTTVASDKKLMLVQMLYRHGDRSPTAEIPSLEREHPVIWPQGLGQLTHTGMLQEYNVGKYLREHYVDSKQFLPQDYSQYDVYVRSTDYDRTLMSAECELAGLFPSKKDIFQTSNSFPWQPVPVHTIPRPLEDFLLPDNCKAYLQEYERLQKSELYQSKEQENAPVDACRAVDLDDSCTNLQFISRLQVLTEIPNLNLSGIFKVADPLFCRREHNVSYGYPTWAGEGGKGDIAYQHILNLQAWEMFNAFGSTLARRLSGGKFLKEVISIMKQKINDPKMVRKFFMYSAHDTTIAMALEAMNADHWRATSPPYASALFFELYNDIEGNHFVQVRYKNHSELTDWEFSGQLLTLPGCDSDMCELDTFEQSIIDVIPIDWQTECNVHQKDGPDSVALMVSIACVSFLIILFVVYLIKSRSRQGGNKSAMRLLRSIDDEDQERVVFTDR